MIEALQRLKSHLIENPARGRAYEILLFMVNSSLERPDSDEKLTFEADALLKSCGTFAERDKGAKDWIPNIKVLNRALRLAQPADEPRLRMGYMPGGGRGVVSLYWLELLPANISAQEESAPSSTVVYRRSENGSIKPSFAARLFLRDGMMPNLSVRGITFLSTILLGSVISVAMLGVMLLSLSLSEGPITMASLITLAVTLMGFVFIWKQVYAPWFQVIDDCIVKAPLWVTALREDGCELEMFRQEKYRWTRLVRFSTDCPICGSNVELRPGKPDQKYPLVGRCVESPYAHVYSFDRMTLRGTYLGPIFSTTG
ncbi:hypothetical protein [Halopseudomonas sp.]|uniref:hypothetical protein n=1 Tax=Halopseudomonas sp. TaxID=2901191 RepID=UPI003562DCB8